MYCWLTSIRKDKLLSPWGEPKEPGFYRLIVDEEPIEKVAVPTRENLEIIPGDKRTEKAKRTVVISNFPNESIARALRQADYDVVILDLPPSLGVLHVSALMASDWVLIPTRLDAMAVDGVDEVLRSMAEVVDRGRQPGYSILPTFYDRTTRETVIQLQALFLKLIALGFQGIGTTESRAAGPWEIQFNLLRAFRPKRMSSSLTRGSQVPFDPAGFHFNKPFLRKETFWSGQLRGRSVDLLYNKFPFVELHGLLVPDREATLPQFLSRPYHQFVWELAQEWGSGLPGMGFGYNGYGAHASVNHLHFQMFVRDRPLPLLAPQWQHNGGEREYPTPCAVFDRPDEAWRYLDHLHREEEPYNLLYLPGRLYCLPRAHQGNYQPAPWSGGFAWYEMAGGTVAFNREQYQALDAVTMAQELRRVGVAD